MSTAPTIFVLDLGLGNVASICRMIEKVGGKAKLIRLPSNLRPGTSLVLPGVGHFDHGVRILRAAGFDSQSFSDLLEGNCRILGICLGMQLLCKSSEEGSELGLGLINAEVKRFRFPAADNLKVPHVGWNVVRPERVSPLFTSFDQEYRFYFVHSYQVIPDDASIIIGTANYGVDFCAAFQKDNIFGVQFHPEKSHRFGMALLKRFVAL